jgi:hypothetical protein
VVLAIDLDENLVEPPTPVRECPHPVDPFAPDLSGEHWPEPVPPEPLGLVADVDAAMARRSSRFLSDRGYFTYIMTTSRMISGDELKYPNGL